MASDVLFMGLFVGLFYLLLSKEVSSFPQPFPFLSLKTAADSSFSSLTHTHTSCHH